MPAVTAPSTLRPNITRVRDTSGFVGTVLYVGPVASAKSQTEIYAGIAWDDVTRGKHDGSVISKATNQIVRHFKCGPTQGSFLKLSKVDVGVELTPQLMRSRYVRPDAALIAPGNLLPHVALTSSGREKPIEFYGEVKLRNRQQLEVVEDISLRMLGISKPPPDVTSVLEEIAEFNHLRGIDLAGNLLSDWEDVLKILRLFPNLQTISLASNRVNDLGSVSLGTSFLNVKSLNLNNCNIESFQTIASIGAAMPYLEELCVAHCNLADIESFDASSENQLEILFKNLLLLDLSNCQLTSWQRHIMKLQNLPRLESLIVNDNPIHCIEGAIEGGQPADFPYLTSLQLAETNISTWTALDQLNRIPSLRSLRLRNTPLTNTLGVGEVRSTAIARLPNLEYFNASPITDRERVEAERRYVSTVSRELLLISSGVILAAERDTDVDGSAGNDDSAKQAQMFAKHPQFQLLVEKHKDTMLSLSNAGNGSTNQGSIGEEIINVTIRSMAAASCDMEPLRKRLPRSLKVGRIKTMCAKYFRVDIDLQMLHFRAEDDPFPSELDDAEHSLFYYGVNDGAEILVNEIDVEALEREKARQLEDHSRRVKEQEQHVTVLQSMKKNDQRINALATEMAQNRV
ncbi:hypothetical protein ACHAWT_003772 [Skeletonema menzelii]